MNWKKLLAENHIFGILLVVLVAFSVWSGVSVFQQNQDLRREASTSGEPITYRTPATPPPGCYYQQVECFQAPCDPILVCPEKDLPPTPAPDGCEYRQVECFQEPCAPILFCDDDDGSTGEDEVPRAYLLGDINRDNQINLLDFTIMQANFGLAEFDPLTDLNNDGRLNLLDFAILNTVFNSIGNN